MPALSDAELRALLDFAHTLADAARQQTLPYFRRPIAVEDKGASGLYDPVTQADRAAEEAIRSRIKSVYPDHGILGEEHGYELGASPFTWVIDPIDGTRSFIAGVPLWGTLIALNDGERPIFGIMDQPYLRERFVGSRLGAELVAGSERRTLQARPCADLSSAVLLCTDPGMFEGAEQEAFAALSTRVRLRRFGTDCHAYGLLAHGLVDLVVESGLKPYDIQALVPIVEAAGGVVTDWAGGPCYDGGQVVAAGDPRMHAAALAVLADAARPAT